MYAYYLWLFFMILCVCYFSSEGASGYWIRNTQFGCTLYFLHWCLVSNIVVLIHSIHPGYWLSSTLSLRLLTFQITCHSNKVKPIFLKFEINKKNSIYVFFCFLVPLIFHNRWSLCEHCLLLWCSLHLMAWCAFNDPLMIIMTIIYLMTCKFIFKGQAFEKSFHVLHK